MVAGSATATRPPEFVSPPKPEWIPSDNLRGLPAQWAQRLARRPPSCMVSGFQGGAFPPCATPEACDLQLFLLNWLREKAASAEQELEQAMFALRLAKQSYVKVLAQAKDYELIPSGWADGEADVAKYNLHNWDTRIVDNVPQKVYGEANERKWNTFGDFELELQMQRNFAKSSNTWMNRDSERQKGSFRFDMTGPPMHLDMNPHHYTKKYTPSYGLTPDLGYDEVVAGGRKLNAYGNRPEFF
mmetsp:Transcript_5001/g.12570  ORF Transcript_5001/g.12570 Transcript_5001/m.12570 type:complete len:243 (-) Transcript_5001:278-1006(-)|eukprot:CAMPEP_0178998656 /NCGR_PEP_ID=MMETSP0795-20121207/9628_1 /TAXON_ID=88552 /ORGANISM="Amoebophrya sp., Strain Ameob2" /LENGTH=242 /DNA_ID=CAMNT_0020691347 /DNA_START=1 /DNA_END=729 /DNA_ORIENTATION=+